MFSISDMVVYQQVFYRVNPLFGQSDGIWDMPAL